MHPRRKPTLVLLATLLVFCFLAIQPSPTTALAELTFLVNSGEDLPDFAGNGVCSANQAVDGPCTLRAAINEANTNIHYTPVTILVPPGIYTLTIPPGEYEEHKNGDLDIQSRNSTNLITIKSTGAPGDVIITTAPNFQDRILEIEVANVSIRDITFSGSHLVIKPYHSGGGAIYNSGNLDLDGVKFINNSVSCKPGENCTNDLVGGAIFNKGTLSIVDSSFIRNTADRGSAIFTSKSEAFVDISYSTFTHNSSSTIINYSILSFLNSTLSGGDKGILNYEQLFLRSCTMANFSETIRNGTEGTVYVRDSIFSTAAPKIFVYTSGNWLSGGYNIFSDNSWPDTYNTGDLSNTKAKLGLLGYYGGPTLTHPLLKGSPAIDHRPGKCVTSFFEIEDDQRYFPRNDGKCDTGAFEHSGNYFRMIYLPFIRR